MNRKFKAILPAFASAMLVFSCSKTEKIILPTKPEESITETNAFGCKLAHIDRGNGNTHEYIYGANGRIVKMKRNFDGDGSGKISQYVYDFEYNDKNLLAKSTWALDGIAEGSETYEYIPNTNQVSKVTFTYLSGLIGTNVLKYDEKGRAKQFITDASIDDYDVIQYFEYDQNDIMIKRGYTNLDGSVTYYEARTKPKGLAKSAEYLIAIGGLPYDVLYGNMWSNNEGGEGSEISKYFPDENGNLVQEGEPLVITKIEKYKGYVTRIGYSDGSPDATFGLIGCSLPKAQ